MATKNMSYDHAAYKTPVLVGGEIAAAASSKTQRFAAYTAMAFKSVNVSVITAGGTVNVIDVIRQAAGGTALTTLASVSNVIGTHAGGVTTNVLNSSTVGTLAQGDIIWAAKGSADGTGNYAIGFELALIPGANVTA